MVTDLPVPRPGDGAGEGLRSSASPAEGSKTLGVTVRHLVSIFVWAVVLVWFFFFLGPFKLVLLGLLAALCLSSVLRPALLWLPGPRALKGFLLGLVPIVVCAGLLFVSSWLLVRPIQKELSYWPATERQFNAWLAGVGAHLGMGPDHPLTVSALLLHVGRILDNAGFVHGLTGNVVDVVIGIVLVFIGTIYLLAEPSENVIPPVLDLLSPYRRQQARAAIDALEPRLRWWLIGALITATIIGLTSLLGFWLIGLNFMIPLAILAGISEFVPTIGPAFAFLIALAFAATQSVDTVLWLLSLYVVVHILESYILIPIVYKEAVRVPPIVTLFTVVFWGEIFGIGGLLLAIPINLLIWTVAEHFIGHKGEVVATDAAGKPIPRAELMRETSG